MRFLPALAALFGSIVPCAASPITSYYNANIVTASAASTLARVRVRRVRRALQLATPEPSLLGESITYDASSVARAGALGGRVSLSSNTFNSSGPGVMVDSFEQLVDSVTAAGPGLGTGFVALFYTLEGTNTASGVDAGARFGPHGVPYACVKAGVGDPLFPFGCAAYDQPAINGTFSAGTSRSPITSRSRSGFNWRASPAPGSGPAETAGLALLRLTS